MYLAFVVVGAESTGTRLMTEILMHAGCDGDATHEQRFDNGFPPASKHIVFRRSFPHANITPDLTAILRDLRKAGYSPRVIVMTREIGATASSQLLARHCVTEWEALMRIQGAYRAIFEALCKESVAYVIVAYEALTTSPKHTVANLFRVLDFPVGVIVKNENGKHYDTDDATDKRSI